MSPMAAGIVVMFLIKDPLSTKMRIIALILSYVGLISNLVSYIYPSWSTFNHNGQTGSLGIHKMCADEYDGSWDCRDVSDKDFLFYLFQTFSTVGVVCYVLFALSVTMTFSSCIKSPKAVAWNKLFIVIFDLVAFNCLMIAIGTGLKTEFLGTVKISYGCVLCIVAFSLAIVLCPVYLTDAKNTAKQFKKKHYAKFEDTQETSITEETVRTTQLTEQDVTDGMKYRSINPST